VKADGIKRVTEALRDRLNAALSTSGLPGTVFVGPLDDPGAAGAPLVLFLYRVVPNANLRNSEHRVLSGSLPPSVEVFQNSLPLDLYFLLTIGSTPNSPEDSMLLGLGFAIQAIQGKPELTGSSVSHETVRLTFEPLSTEEASRIWALFPTANYRTSVAYLATPVWIDPATPAPVAGPVMQQQLNTGHKAEELTQ
jgi:hypothetical protein